MKSIRTGKKLIEIKRPLAMGIVNVTSDSFYSGSRVTSANMLKRVEDMLEEGVDIIDIGGCSTRPGSEPVSKEAELEAVIPTIKEIRKRFTDSIISVDTFRSGVAAAAIEAGADIINDVSGGADPEMFDTAARYNVPYVLTHNAGIAGDDASIDPEGDSAATVLSQLAFKADKLHQMGVNDVIIDPGFGFGKTLDENYRLLAYLNAFEAIGCVIMVGASRKSMIYKELGCSPEKALYGTIALHTIALMNGADILRVHDVKAARDAIDIF